MPRKSLTTAEFIARAQEAHGNRYDYSQVFIKNTKTKIEILCSDHGMFLQQPSVHMKGQGCPECYKSRLVEIRRKKEEKRNAPRKPRGNPFKNKTLDEMAIIQSKKQQTCIARYGVENPSQHNEIKNKKAETLLSNYGVNNPMYSDVVKSRLRETVMSRYGADNPMKNESIKDRLSKTMTKKYGGPYTQFHIPRECLEIIQSKTKLKEYVRDKCILNAANMLGISQPCLSQYLIRHGLNEPGRSTYERELKSLFDEWGLDFKPNDRTIIYPNELDFVFPEYKIAIEFCGLYFHAQTTLESRNQSGKRYHVAKLNKCEENGLRLITIFEDEWFNRKETVIRRLKYLFNLANTGVAARLCSVQKIDEMESKAFLDMYHVQGNSTGACVRYGAYHNESLVGVMTFSKPRLALSRSMASKNNNAYELLRFSTDGDTHPGLASKMFKRFLSNYEPSNVVSYADRRWSTGDLYYQLGFIHTKVNNPNYWYINPNKIERHHRFKFRKQVIIEKMNGDPNLTEWENMRNMRFDRIWDCGTLRFEWKSAK